MPGNITLSGYSAIVRKSNSSSHVIPDIKRKQVQHRIAKFISKRVQIAQMIFFLLITTEKINKHTYKAKITCNCREISFQLRANFRAVTERMRYTTQTQEGGAGR